jgi:ricin-type beta-trefoil lectin protein
MGKTARIALLAVLALGLAGGALAARRLLTASSVHGTEFQIQTLVDQSFCVTTDNGTSEGRETRLQNCGSSFGRFTFTDNSDGTNLIVDSQGMCLDGRFRPRDAGLPLKVFSCRFSDRFRWSYLADGEIQNALNGLCLRVPGAANNAVVSLGTCDASNPAFRWLVTH